MEKSFNSYHVGVYRVKPLTLSLTSTQSSNFNINPSSEPLFTSSFALYPALHLSFQSYSRPSIFFVLSHHLLFPINLDVTISGFLLSLCPISAKDQSFLVYNCLPALFHLLWSFFLSFEPYKVSLYPFTHSVSHFLLSPQHHPPFFEMVRRQSVIFRQLMSSACVKSRNSCRA